VALTDDSSRRVGHDLGMGVKSRSLEFPVSVEWAGGKRVRAYVPGKQMIEIATTTLLSTPPAASVP
jgi:hypothetical protein